MKSNGNIRGLLKTTFIYGLIGGSRTIIEFILLPVYARYLSPGEFGILDILMLMMMVSGVAAMLELGNAVFRFYFDNKSISYRKSVVSSAIVTMAVNSAAIFALFLLFSNFLSNAFFQSSGYRNLIILTGACTFMNAIITVPINLMRIKDQPVKFTVVSLIQISASVIGIIYFVIIMKLGIAGVLISKIISIVPALAICLYYAKDEIGITFDVDIIKTMLKYSLPLIPAGVAIWGINGLNRVFMLYYLNLEQIGFFSVGSKIVAVMTLAVIAFQLAWPHFALSNMNATDSARMFARIFNILAAAGIWIVLALTVLAEPVIRIALTPVYLPAAKVVLPLALGMFMYALFYFFSTGCVFSKKTMNVLPPIGLAVCVNVVLNMIITPRFGFGGTAWVTTVSYFVMASTMYYFTRKSEYVNFNYRKLSLLACLAIPAIAINGWLAGSNNEYSWELGILILVLFPLAVISTGIVKLPASSPVQFGRFKTIEEIPENKKCAESSVD